LARAGLVAALLAPPLAAQDAPSSRAELPRAEPSRAELAAAALALDPAALPRASAERWKDFDPLQPPPAQLRGALEAMRRALEQGDLPLVLHGLHAALRTEPDYPPALHQLGVVYFRLQRYGDALTAFARYLEAVPGRVADTRGLAHALHSLGRYEMARQHYERVLEAAPDDVEARRGLAVSLLRLGEAERARGELARVLEREPQHSEAWTWMAEAEWDLGRTEEALRAAQRARDLRPFAPRPWFLLAQSLGELGREEEARPARERFLLLSRADQAIRGLEAELELDPHDLSRRRALAELLRSVGDVAGVRKNLALAVRESPADVSLRIWALDALDALGDREGAQSAARELERVGAESVAAWRRLEAWYARIGDRARQLEAGERWRRLGG
jgi:tetratricopeptide (TPR) repeat protein